MVALKLRWRVISKTCQLYPHTIIVKGVNQITKTIIYNNVTKVGINSATNKQDFDKRTLGGIEKYKKKTRKMWPQVQQQQFKNVCKGSFK